MALGNPGGGWAQVNAAPDYQNVGAVHSSRTTANIAYADGHVGQIRPMYDIPVAAAAAGVNDAFFLAVLP